MPPVAPLKVLFCQAGEADSVELPHPVPELLKDSSHNPVLSGVDLKPHLCVVFRLRVGDGISAHCSVIKGDPAYYHLHIMPRHLLVSEDMVYLPGAITGVCKLPCQVTVICQQQYSRS